MRGGTWWRQLVTATNCSTVHERLYTYLASNLVMYVCMQVLRASRHMTLIAGGGFTMPRMEPRTAI
jgi:hypothetical protein